jgi:GNAT superfamily N-acetyltransferase
MRFPQILAKIRRNFGDYGFRITSKKAFAGLLTFFFEKRTYCFYVRRLTPEDLEEPLAPPPAGIRFHDLQPEDDEWIAQIEQTAEWLQGEIRTRLTQGSLCLIALDGNTVAAFNLISFGTVYIPLLKLHKHFRKDQAWSEHIAVQKNYRQHGLAASLRKRIFQELYNRGIRKLYGGTLPTNAAALGLARKTGFKQIADVTYYRLFHAKNWLYERRREE